MKKVRYHTSMRAKPEKPVPGIGRIINEILAKRNQGFKVTRLSSTGEVITTVLK